MLEKFYKLETPKKIPPNDPDILGILIQPSIAFKQFLERTETPKYLHWIDLKNKSWLLEGWPHEKIWALIKYYRHLSRVRNHTVIRDQHGHYFSWLKLERYERFFHMLDMETGGTLGGISRFSEIDKRRFISRNIIEEAITSSQLEGANTSRTVATKMLLEGRKPRDYAERMIVNNYKAMQLIEHDYIQHPLSMEMLLELHKVITEGTLKNVELAGAFRKDRDEKGNPLVIKPFDHETISYITPPIAFVKEELIALIKFANNEEEGSFIHPVVKAIMLHFWIGLLHPFEDGNGRLARVLFYWYMLKEGYWAFAYLSLSERLLKSPKQYSMAYIFTEQDDNDLTYFIDYNILKIQEAQEQFKVFIASKINENKTDIQLMQNNHHFNDRQIKLLQYLYHHMQEYTTLSIHSNLYKIGKVTAITDLKGLEKLGFLTLKKRGRNSFYYATEQVRTLFRVSL